MAGGLYDQHPDILDRFAYMLSEQEKQRQKEENERKRRESGPASRKPGRSSRAAH